MAPSQRQTKIPPYNEEEGLEHAHRGRSRTILTGRLGAISLRAVPLKNSVFQALREKKLVEDCEEDLMQLGKALGMEATSTEHILASLSESVCFMDAESGSAMVESASLRRGATVRGVESSNDEVYVPPKSIIAATEENDDYGEEDGAGGPAIVEKAVEEYVAFKETIQKLGFSKDEETLSEESSTQTSANAGALAIWNSQMRGSLSAGFRMALRAGPICEEPVRGVLVVLEGVEVAVLPSTEAATGYSCAKPLSGGMVVSALRSGIRCALLTRPSRLMESHLKLTLHSSLAGIGALYGVLSKRRGKVVEDAMVEGTDLLMITATIPHAESFGLAPELFRQSSGEVTAPELVFSHWERLEQDPFWIPTSLEEREDFGEILQNGDVSTGMDNTALKYIRQVRQRKGLLVDSSRTVVAAEKQRTMKR